MKKFLLVGALWVLGTVSILTAIYGLRSQPKTWVVCFLDIGGPVCPLYIEADSYVMNGGCATFSDGQTICRVVGIVPAGRKAPEGGEENGPKSNPTVSDAR